MGPAQGSENCPAKSHFSSQEYRYLVSDPFISDGTVGDFLVSPDD